MLDEHQKYIFEICVLITLYLCVIFVYLYICICVIETDLSERLCGSNQPTFSEALPKADPWEISGFVLLIDRTFVKVLQSRLFLEGHNIVLSANWKQTIKDKALIWF